MTEPLTEQQRAEQKVVRQEMRALEAKRRERMRELMEAFDREEYFPARQKLQERCADIGHQPGNEWHDNGVGFYWRYCSVCQARVELTGPDGAICDQN